MQNPYEILGIDKDASKNDIKTAYRRMAMKYHPDRNKDEDSLDKFKEIKNAYEFLSDDNKRAAFDRGHIQYGDNHQYNPFGFGGGEDIDINDIFNSVFSGFGMGGNARRRAQQERENKVNFGSDIEIQVEIDFLQSMKGDEIEVGANIPSVCKTCSGSGAENGEHIDCSKCRGRGSVQMNLGGLVMERMCNNCQGEGKVIKNKCGDCLGKGEISIKKVWKVSIPAGTPNGLKIRLEDQGIAGLLNTGDAYIRVFVKESDVFVRDKNDVYMKMPLRSTKAIVGGIEKIKTWEDEFEIQIPQGINHGERISIKNRGSVNYKNPKKRGDLHIIVDIQTPKDLTDEQIKKLIELDDELSADDLKKDNLWEKMKKSFS